MSNFHHALEQNHRFVSDRALKRAAALASKCPPSLTISALHQGCGWALYTPLCLCIGDKAGVVAHIRWLHLGYVQVPRLLRHKPPIILLDMQWVVIEGPGIRQV